MTSPEVNPMKIAYLFDGYFDDTQGVPSYVKTLGSHMSIRGHEPHYIVGGTTEDDPNTTVIGRTATFGVNGNEVEIAIPISARRADQILDLTDPSIIHLQMPHNPLVSGRIVSRANEDVPTVATFHVLPNSKRVTNGLRLLGKFEKHFGHIDQIISNSTATQRFVEMTYGVETPIIPCPINVAELQQGEKIAEYDDGKLNVVFLGRLVERKGVKQLIDAISLVKGSTVEDLRVLIAGKGPLEDSLRDQVKTQGLDETVTFLGYVDDAQKANLFATADLAIFPATGGESFGIVLAEAMAARSGVVIGGDNPGYREVLADTPELIIDPYDSKELALLITELAYDSRERERLHAIQQQAVKKFDVGVVGVQIEEVYQELI